MVCLRVYCTWNCLPRPRRAQLRRPLVAAGRRGPAAVGRAQHVRRQHALRHRGQVQVPGGQEVRGPGHRSALRLQNHQVPVDGGLVGRSGEVGENG